MTWAATRKSAQVPKEKVIAETRIVSNPSITYSQTSFKVTRNNGNISYTSKNVVSPDAARANAIAITISCLRGSSLLLVK